MLPGGLTEQYKEVSPESNKDERIAFLQTEIKEGHLHQEAG